MTLKNNILFSFFLFFFAFGFSQINSVEPENIKTIILKPFKTNTYAPIIRLGEKIQLIFDDLNADEHTYTYKIEHCDFDWNISNLSESEFVNGYSEDRIRDYENSFNTLQPFTNYKLTIPNENTEIKISGNYIISVLNEDEELVFKRAFVVFEPKVTVGVALFRSRDIAKISTQQAVEFTINNSIY